MNPLRLSLLLVPALAACAPTTGLPSPTRVTTVVTYRTGVVAAGDDNPVLAAVVATAPTIPTLPGRMPWKAEEIERNQVVLRSRAETVNTFSFGSTVRTLPYEMLFTVISSAGTTTLTGTYSKSYEVSAQALLNQLDRRFPRVR
ncbi:hypothetical protein [Deinococcus koreensis]|uniref:Uncharacterized protein n=1 Tax=Deinococcus koreensis TaxID=2054903 RepID=A0A2K3URM5_9DEIO|nr:hypothetical protein [Deinococcus koreensis]PNY79196.1 hypothetical protein CVO96_20570 [Deinococcus koreensis]